jgi:hypothetical protein
MHKSVVKPHAVLAILKTVRRPCVVGEVKLCNEQFSQGTYCLAEAASIRSNSQAAVVILAHIKQNFTGDFVRMALGGQW